MLVSVDIGDRLDALGSDEVVHLQSDKATQIVPSPDGKWVAFAERYHAYVAPFPRTGPADRPGPDDRGLSDGAHLRDAGIQPALVGRQPEACTGRSVPSCSPATWRRTFTFLAQDLEKPDRAGSEGRRPSASPRRPTCRTAPSPSSAPASSPPRRRHVIENGTIVVEGNRIAAVGRERRDARPARADRRPRQDDHAGHHRRPRARRRRGRRHPRASELAARWPTSRSASPRSHDPSNDTETVFTNAEMIRAGLKLGPRVCSRPAHPLRRGNAVQGGRSRPTTTRWRTCGG